ncbi:hypothetical protein TsFJ059_002591 [Trichoderma semiorbis]|uniref:HMG box domain-containing protein n=1 Tax=Trichoderma semiorbis TaxID=1491008 RepID=A0A9P8HTT4_9HYPO|nr:hypothetical protein TsFJ059_002591 [Trichoderma semiorbis]
MTANATILHSYSPARGVGVIERIKAEHEAQQFPSQLIPEYVQFPGYHHPSQYPISPPLSREGTRADTKHNLVAPSQYKLEVSPLDYPHVSGGVMPSEGPDDDALDEYFSDSSEPPSKKRKTRKKNKKPVAPGDMITLEATLSQIAEAKGCYFDLLGSTQEFVYRSTEERLGEERTDDGSPKRPMNSFMLYRHTFRPLVGEIRHKNKNEQKTSILCGVSWKLESKAFRKEFKKLAELEKANLLRAFPDYKYSPSKSKKGGEKLVKGRASTTTGRVTRSRKPSSKTKKLHHLSEEMLQLAIDEQQSPPAEAVHPQPYLTSVAFPPHSTLYAEGYGAELSYVVYPDPDQYQRHYIATTYGDVYSQSRISPPVVVHALYEDTENPNGNHNEGFIDPKLLLGQSGMHNSTSCSVAIQQRSQPAPIERSRAETSMSSWDSDVYAPFLSGRDGDWEVVQLDKRGSNDEQLDGSESSFFGEALMAQAQEV